MLQRIFLLSILSMSLGAVQYERVITSSKVALKGVPIDYRYNQTILTRDSFGGIVSAPGCPKSEAGIPWVYHGYPPKCYLPGDIQEPCGLSYSLFVNPKSHYGVCNCDCFEDGHIPWFDFNKLQFCRSHTIVDAESVYYPALKRCFTIFLQGPCDKSHWLVKVRNGRGPNNWAVQCEPKRCPLGRVPAKGRNPNSATFDPKRHCVPVRGVAGLGNVINPNHCPRGTRHSRLLQKCLKTSHHRVRVGK